MATSVRTLITGGAGFIGSHVAEQLLELGTEVAVLDNLSTGRRENVPRRAKLYEVDLRDREATLRAVLDFRPDTVCHQAAQASVAVSVREPRLDAEVNVLGGLNLLDARDRKYAACPEQPLRDSQARHRATAERLRAAPGTFGDHPALCQRVRSAPGSSRRGRRRGHLLRLGALRALAAHQRSP